ncbi:SRPBCC family protein [Qipengyuania sp. CAU 1752]
MSTIPRPSLGKSPRALEAERLFAASPAELYDAWTTMFDRWFAQEGTLSMVREVGSAWFFYNREEWGRHPHYGRFLALKVDQMIETTWLTGNGSHEGTWGAETILKIQVLPSDNGTKLKLTHSGFVSDESRDAHAANWPIALDELAAALEGKKR